jgi:hypothetical protein
MRRAFFDLPAGGEVKGEESIMTILGTPGDDNLTGTAGDDVFDLRQGGNDTAQGLAGNDIFTFGATFTAADTIDGGAGADQIRLNGDYSAGVVFAATTMTDVQSIALSGGFTYNLTTDDANVAAGSHLTVNGANLTAGGALLFNGTDETDGHFILTGGGQGNDILRGGTGADTFNIGTNAVGNGGSDRVEGRNGNDIINVGAALDSTDKIDGGLGNDTIVFDGDYTGAHALTLAPTTVENIVNFVFDAGHSYDITSDDRTVAPSHALNVDASLLGAGDSLTFDASAETDGQVFFLGGQGNDDLRGGVLANAFNLGQGGNDAATGGNGNDVFNMGAALNSGDMLYGGGGIDRVVISGDYTHANALTLTAGTLQQIGVLEMLNGSSYHVTVDGNMAGFNVLLDPTAGTVFFNAGADKNDSAAFTFLGATTGNYILTGGYSGDVFNMQNATQYTLRGGHGDDTFTVGTGFTASDSIDGGGGDDTVSFTGGGIVIGASNVVNIEQYFLGNVTGGFAYNFTITDADMPAGGRLFISGGSLGTNNTLTVDGSAVTSGSLLLTGGGGSDTLIGGAGNDGLGMAGGANNAVTGNGGGDTIDWFNTVNGTAIYNSVSDSTGANHDTFIDVTFSGIGEHMQIHALGALPTAIDTPISGGALSKATFDADLAADVNASNLAAGHAVIFKAIGGDLTRHFFLIVDENGVAGYQAGQDLVVDVTQDNHGGLTTAFFI